MVTRVPEHRCPFCDHLYTAVECFEEPTILPNEDDRSICIKCGEWAIFTAELKLRKPTDVEHIDIGFDPVCRVHRKAWLDLKEAQDRGEIPRLGTGVANDDRHNQAHGSSGAAGHYRRRRPDAKRR